MLATGVWAGVGVVVEWGRMESSSPPSSPLDPGVPRIWPVLVVAVETATADALPAPVPAPAPAV